MAKRKFLYFALGLVFIYYSHFLGLPREWSYIGTLIFFMVYLGPGIFVAAIGIAILDFFLPESITSSGWLIPIWFAPAQIVGWYFWRLTAAAKAYRPDRSGKYR
jgi:hypothetical protein